jgi:transmembrane sensor
VAPDATVRAMRLSGVFRSDDPTAVIDAMRASLGLKTVSLPGIATLVYR